MIDVRYANPIRVYEIDLSLVGELDDYSSAYFTRSWYGIGEFSIQTNYNTVHATDLQKGRIVMFGKDKYRVGIITTIKKTLNEDGLGGQIITASGYEIKFIFTQRIVLPTTARATYALSNSAETVMKTLVSDQAGPTAGSARQFPNLIIASDADRGSTYVLSARYNATVADELQKIAMATDVGYFIYIDEVSGDFVFDVSLGTDRSSSQAINLRAIFSENYDTIKRAEFITSDNQYRNHAYVAGLGAGTARTIREVYSASAEQTGFDRKEIFVDARDLTTTTELDARGAQKLGEYAIQTTVDGMPLTYSPLVYRTDYDLGDIVTVDVYDSPYDARITEVKESWEPLSYEIDVVFDKEPATLPLQVSRSVELVRANLTATEISLDTFFNRYAWFVTVAGSGTFTIPTDKIKRIYVLIFGGGGGGKAGDSTNAGPGGGAGAGALFTKTIDGIETFDYTLGNLGAGGQTSGASGSNGTASQFESLILGPGLGATLFTAGGAGGIVSGSYGDFTMIESWSGGSGGLAGVKSLTVEAGGGGAAVGENGKNGNVNVAGVATNNPFAYTDWDGFWNAAVNYSYGSAGTIGKTDGTVDTPATGYFGGGGGGSGNEYSIATFGKGGNGGTGAMWILCTTEKSLTESAIENLFYYSMNTLKATDRI